MNEKEWLASKDWRPMGRHLDKKMHKSRKARLFSVACCRRIAHLFEDSRSDVALEISEQFADEQVSKERLKEVEAAVLAAVHEAVARHGPHVQAWARDAMWRTSRGTFVWHGAQSCLTAVERDPAELEAQTVLLRDIFGNPFRPTKRERSWLTSDVVTLARGIYDDRAFDRMPILADALQDAGCTNDDVLTHCRDTTQVHVRGCWVVDLLLGKK